MKNYKIIIDSILIINYLFCYCVAFPNTAPVNECCHQVCYNNTTEDLSTACLKACQHGSTEEVIQSPVNKFVYLYERKDLAEMEDEDLFMELEGSNCTLGKFVEFIRYYGTKNEAFEKKHFDINTGPAANRNVTLRKMTVAEFSKEYKDEPYPICTFSMQRIFVPPEMRFKSHEACCSGDQIYLIFLLSTFFGVPVFFGCRCTQKTRCCNSGRIYEGEKKCKCQILEANSEIGMNM